MINVDCYGDAVPVPAFGPRMVCTSCGIIGAFARPNWQERALQIRAARAFLRWRATLINSYTQAIDMADVVKRLGTLEAQVKGVA